MTARLSARQRLARVHPFVWIGAAALIGALVAWPLGGWDTVEPQSTKVPQVEPGELVPGHQYSVRVESANLTTVPRDGFSELDPGRIWLEVELEVTNVTDLTQFSSDIGSDYKGAITVDGGLLGQGQTLVDDDGALIRAQPYLVSDATYLPDLQPDLPTRIVVTWQVRDDQWEVGDELRVGIVDRTPFPSVLGEGTSYGFPKVVAETVIPIERGAQA